MTSQPTTSNLKLMGATAGSATGIACSDSEISIFTQKPIATQELRWPQMYTLLVLLTLKYYPLNTTTTVHSFNRTPSRRSESGLYTLGMRVIPA